MTNPQTVGEWNAAGFRVVEAGEIDRYPRLKFEPPRAAKLAPARARPARVRHRASKKDERAYRYAVQWADIRAAAYNRKTGLDTP